MKRKKGEEHAPSSSDATEGGTPPAKPSPQKALADGARHAQEVLEGQGFLVFGCRIPRPVGSIIPFIAIGEGSSELIPGPIVVIAESTYAEWRAQRIAYHPDHDAGPAWMGESGFRFYRAVAE